jgi:hypothetical protein
VVCFGFDFGKHTTIGGCFFFFHETNSMEHLEFLSGKKPGFEDLAFYRPHTSHKVMLKLRLRLSVTVILSSSRSVGLISLQPNF